MVRQQGSGRNTPARQGQQSAVTSFFKAKPATSDSHINTRKTTDSHTTSRKTSTTTSQPLSETCVNTRRPNTPNTPVQKTVIDDSSDEDELASLESIIRPRRTHLPSPTTTTASHFIDMSDGRGGRDSRSQSPPSRVPVTSGAFNLKALLSDRSIRLEQKATIERLDASEAARQSGDGAGKNTTGSSSALVSERVQRLLSRDKKEEKQYWCTVRDVVKKGAIEVLAELRDRLLGTLLQRQGQRQEQRQEQLGDVDQVCYWLQRQRQELSASLIEYMMSIVAQSTDEVDVDSIGTVLRDADITIEAAMALLYRVSGLTSSTKSGDGEHCSQTIPPPAKPLHAVKIRTALSLVNHAIEHSSSKTIGLPFIRVVLQTLTTLHLDYSYGHLLQPTLLNLHRTLSLHATEEVLLTAHLSLLDITTSPQFQIQILESLPLINDRACIARLQIMASMFLLSLDAAHVNVVQSTDSRLRKLITHVQSNRPFHPLDNDTSYEDLKLKISLLSFATSYVETSHGVLTQRLIDVLQTLHGQIIDSKAAFITRSEAKAAIQRLSDRLKYTLAAQGRKHSVFEHFS